MKIPFLNQKNAKDENNVQNDFYLQAKEDQNGPFMILVSAFLGTF